VQAYTDIREMISRTGIQAVCVCTPHPAHAISAIPAIKLGSHVLIEKPMASSLEDCDAILKAAAKAKIKLGMISQRRLYAPVQRIKKAIDDGKLAQPVLGVVSLFGWRDQSYYTSDPWRGSWEGEGGGVLVNQSPHHLDLLLWYLGDVEELFGHWANLNHPYIEVDDTATATIRFKNGAVGSIVVSNSQNPALYGKVSVHGSNGVSVGVQTDGGAMFIAGISEIQEPPFNDLWTIPGETDQVEKWKKEDTLFFKRINPMEYYHQLQIRDFLQSISHDRPPMITGAEGRKTVELFTAIYRSQRDRKSIKFPLTAEKNRSDYDGRLPVHVQ
jgi:predicted dehydrogenase